MRTLAGFLAFLLIAAAPSEKEKQPDYYPLKEGNKWHYKVTMNDAEQKPVVVQVAKIEKIGDEMLARVESLLDGKVAATEHMAVNEKGVFRHRTLGAEVIPPYCLCKLPFKKGGEWKAESKIGNETIKANLKSSEEDIEVPSGKYKTIRIESQIIAGALKFDTTIWLADGVGMVKQTIDLGGKKTTLELEKFEKAKEK